MKKIILLFLAFIILLSATVCSVIMYKRLLHLDTYKDDIVAALQKTLQRRIVYEKGTYHLGLSPSFTFTKVALMEKDNQSVFASTDQLTIKIAIIPLLEKKLLLKEVLLEKPLFRLLRDKNGIFNFNDMMEGKKEKVSLQIGSIGIRHGSATFIDQAVAQPGAKTSLEDIDLLLNGIERGKETAFKISAIIKDGKNKVPLAISGSAKIAAGNKPLTDTSVSIKMTAKGLESGNFWDYYSRYVPFRKIIGRLDIESTFKGKLALFSSKGTVKVAGLRFDYPTIFHGPLTPKELQFTYDMELSSRDLTVKKLNLNVDGLSVKGSCALKDIYSKDLLISAKATTNPFILEKFKQYIPYGVIPKDVADFIEQYIVGGTYQLQNGRLEGRVSQIAHMEKGSNYNVLLIEGTVDKGLLKYGSNTPPFNTIKGRLAMRGKDFVLSGMEGRFGGSPFTLEGKIIDYPLTTPSSYPFTMTMTPQAPEVAWLLKQEKSGRLGFSGHSILSLAGKGFTSNYSLNGKWDLTAASYSYQDTIDKPAGRVNNLSFQSLFNNEEVQVTALQYKLDSLDLKANGVHRFTAKHPSVFSINTNQFQIQEIAPMLPLARKYLPSGRIKVAAQGTKANSGTKELHLKGNLSLSGVSLTPTAKIKHLSDITGEIRFSDNFLETSLLTARVGKSTLSGSGNLTGFNNPTLNLAFSSPALDFSDLGIQSSTRPVTVKKVHGSISLKERNLQIKSLSFILNRSSLNLSGSVTDILNPKIDITLTSPYLELEDIVMLRELELAKGESPPLKVTGRALISAESGSIAQFPFSKLHTKAQFAENVLHLQPIEMNIFGGTLSANGQLDLSATGGARWQAAFDMKKLSAEQLLHGLKAKREVTGTISAQGELSAKGYKMEEIVRTASGHMKLTCEEGALRKFSVLSKIFSILNLSQLLKLQLPEMVSGGMPYDKINATFSVGGGLASTDDLLIDSDAINISVVGKFNLVKKDLDLTIGVKPLQTVDKIISKIPIVGWVLTGKNRTLLTAYFEAKGAWGDPQVSAIPIKSMAKGVLNIFKRVFQLPGKLITDTGEVIIGN